MRYWGWGRFWANCAMEKMEASYLLTISRRYFQTLRLGREASIWQRQIQCLARERISLISQAGWGSCTRTKSASQVNFRAFSRLISS